MLDQEKDQTPTSVRVHEHQPMNRDYRSESQDVKSTIAIRNLEFDLK
jgi:hypothetical protein